MRPVNFFLLALALSNGRKPLSRLLLETARSSSSVITPFPANGFDPLNWCYPLEHLSSYCEIPVISLNNSPSTNRSIFPFFLCINRQHNELGSTLSYFPRDFAGVLGVLTASSLIFVRSSILLDAKDRHWPLLSISSDNICFVVLQATVQKIMQLLISLSEFASMARDMHAMIGHQILLI